MRNAIDIIKQLYAEINRGDIDAMLKLMDTNVLRTEPEDFPTAGIGRGVDELRPQFIGIRSTWDEGSCTPTKFITEGNKTIVNVHIKVRLKTNYWVDTKMTVGFIVQNSLITEYHLFTDNEQAFKWAGITTPTAILND